MRSIVDNVCNYIATVCVADALHSITLEMGFERTETSIHEVRGYTLIMTSPSRGLNVHFFSLSQHYRSKTRLRLMSPLSKIILGIYIIIHKYV